MLETTELFGQIVRLCAEQKSGTLFLTTKENKACHIVFENGRIIAMAYGTVRGVAVADILPRLSLQASQFNSALRMPLSSKSLLNDDSSVFDKLGLRRNAMQANGQTNSIRMYRGHPLPAPSHDYDSVTDKPRKAKRIYRGQVIKD
ncbi:MAG: hypothetical protein R3341_01710 [Methylophaga sp.]|nr:hypothetical protein [Methylophaga sp.]